MDKTAEAIFNIISRFEAEIANKGATHLQPCLRLCMLGLMSSPYIDGKFELGTVLEMSLAKYYGSVIPEVFAETSEELKKHRTKESRIVEALSELNDNWPDALFDSKFGLYDAFKPVQPLVPQMDELLQTVAKLDNVKRDNLLSTGANESDTAHIIKLCIWILSVYPHLAHQVDKGKLLEIALLHDLVEARSGDFSLSAQIADAGLKLEKKRQELEAIMYYRVSFPAPFNNTVFDIFEEYEEQETAEAKIVWAADKLDANWQANQYNDGDIRYWADCPNGEVYYRLALEYKPKIASLCEPVLTSLEHKIVLQAKSNIKKWNIKVK